MAKIKFNNKLQPISSDPMDWIEVEGETPKSTITYMGNKPSRKPNMARVKKAYDIHKSAEKKEEGNK
jgi:hypothetical protein